MGQGSVTRGHEAEFPAGSNSPLTLDLLETPAGAAG